MSTVTPIHPATPIDAARSGPTTTSRVRGAVLVVLGTAMAIGLTSVLLHLAPMLLNSGQADGHSRFTGSAFEAWLVLGVVAWTALLGGVFVFGGMQLWRHGRYHPWFARVAGAMAALTVIGIYRLNHIFT
jgi:hypothetical protein